MRVRSLVAGITLGAFTLTPFITSAQTVNSLESQIEALIAQIEQAEGTASSSQAIATSSTTAATTTMTTTSSNAIICPQLVRNLSYGDTGTDVANLQGFLAQNPLIYPEGSVTAYFGRLTQDAVQRWQSAYHIVTSGTPATTGYGVVGPKTRAAIAASCQAASGNSSSATSPEPITTGGLCAVSPQPSTPCDGTWSALTNAQGCTIAWQCSFALPSATATSSGS